MSGIFISYRHEGGYGVANHLVDRLKRDGYKTIIDKEYKEGDFHERITNSIKECDDFILILNSTVFKVTLEGLPSEIDWVREELKQARKYGKNIIPVMLSEFEWPKELPSDIEFVQNLNAIRYDKEGVFDVFYNKLLGFLKTRCPIKLKIKNFVQDNKIWLGLLLFAAVGTAIYSYINKPNEPVVLVAGGGSVSGKIKDTLPNAMDEVISMPMASSTAWPFVSKEFDVTQNLDNGKPRQYYLVLLSAWKAEASDFLSSDSLVEKFIKSIGYVVGIKIGQSDLKLVLKNDDYFKEYLGQDSLITPKVLAEIVKDPNVTVYTTSNRKRGLSGTYLKYQQVLKPYVDIDTIKCNEYNLDQKFDYFNDDGNHFIILGSSTFSVKSTLDTASWFERFFFAPDSSRRIANDLYVYFVVYKKPNGREDDFEVPKQVRKFVSRIAKLPPDQELGPSKKLVKHYTKDWKKIED